MIDALSRWLPVAVVVGALLVEAATPNLRFAASPDDDLLVRKLGHAGVYGLLALLVRRALLARPTWRPSALREWIVPLLFVAAIATIDELWQLHTPGREGKLIDALTDLTGGVAGLVLLRSWRFRRALRRSAADIAAPSGG